MKHAIRAVKEFRNNLLIVYYAEGQELNGKERKLIEKMLSIADKLLKH